MSDDGSADMIAQMDRLIAGLEGPAIAEAGRQWIDQDCKPVSQQIVPVDTGALRDSIDGTAGSGGVVMFATMPYADDVEFGTSKKGARPYLMPAIQQTWAMLGKRILDAMNRLVK